MGIDFKGQGHMVLGTTLDMGNLFSNRVRLRPSAEIGVFNGENTYVASMEALWRFTDDEEIATPYIGTGGLDRRSRRLRHRSTVSRPVAEPRVRIRAALPVDVQLVARVPRNGPRCGATASTSVSRRGAGTERGGTDRKGHHAVARGTPLRGGTPGRRPILVG